MTETLLVSNVVLWCLVIALAIVVIALARQVGLLHERVSPAGALQPTNGPKVGEITRPMDLRGLDGEPVRVGGAGPGGRPTLVLWVSPTCPVCRALVPTARSLSHDESLRLVFASDGDSIESHRAYASNLGIADFPYVLSRALGESYAVGKLPFAALIGADGVLHSKGLVNNREHLESLLEAMESGIPSLQDYVQRAESESARRLTEQAS